MKKTLKILVIGLATATVISATSVRASIFQNWQETGVGTFTEIDVKNFSGTTLETFGPWGGSGWATTFLTATLGIIQGPSLTSLNYSTTVFGTGTPSFSWDTYVWDGTTLKESWKTIRTGNAWSYDAAAAPTGPDSAVVPEPTTIIAGALLLLPFGLSTVRILRKNRTA